MKRILISAIMVVGTAAVHSVPAAPQLAGPLIAAAAHIRDVVPEGLVSLDPRNFPEPGSLQLVAESIGNARIGTVESCLRPRRGPCRTVPQVRAVVRFQNAVQVRPDSVTVEVEIHQFPPDATVGEFAVIRVRDEVTVVNEPTGWAIAAVRRLGES